MLGLSATLESALEAELRRRRREEWLATNRDRIDAYNREVDERGAFGDALRGF
jgi:antitoxin CcdA